MRQDEMKQAGEMHQGTQEKMEDTRESTTSPVSGPHAAAGQTEPPIVLDPNRKLGRGPIIAAVCAALVLGFFIVIGIHSRVHAEESLTSTTRQESVMAVAVTTPRHGSDALEITLPANTQAFIDTPIYARTNGYLRHWYADIGAHVHAGQVLAEIETPELDQEVQQAQSDLATAQANEQLAQLTAERWKKLVAKNAVSKQEADQASSDFQARSSALESAKANVRRLQQLQGFEKIVAPFDGVITARNVDIGSLIQSGDSDSPRAELFHMAATDKLRLFVPVPEVYANNVHNGDKIVVTSDASPNMKFTGTIVRNSDAIDMTSRTLNVEVDVLNAEHKLRPGQYTFVHLPVPPTNSAMTVPANVILFRGEGLRVGVVRDGHVQLVPVQIGNDYGSTVEITSGLAPQDQVILNPSDSLAQGERVRVEKGEAE